MGLMPGNSGVLDINLEGRIHCRVVGWYSLLGGWVVLLCVKAKAGCSGGTPTNSLNLS